MSVIVKARDLVAEMNSFGDSAELPERTYLVTLGYRDENVDVVKTARGEDEAYALAVTKLRKIYDIPGHERIRRIKERMLELGDLLCLMATGRVEL